MKKIAIIGASGFVGLALLKEALHRNFKTLSISRNTSQLSSIKDPNLTIKSIDVHEVEALSHELKGVDIVISTFNAGWSNPNLYKDNMQGFHDIEKAAKLADVKRFIMIGGAGTLYIDGKQLVDAPNFPTNIKPGAESCRDFFNILKTETSLNWTYFSPAPEMNSEITTGRTGKYRLGTDTPVFDKDGHSKISVEDMSVAIFDEIENEQFIKKQFTAAY